MFKLILGMPIYSRWYGIQFYESVITDTLIMFFLYNFVPVSFKILIVQIAIRTLILIVLFLFHYEFRWKLNELILK